MGLPRLDKKTTIRIAATKFTAVCFNAAYVPPQIKRNLSERLSLLFTFFFFFSLPWVPSPMHPILHHRPRRWLLSWVCVSFVRHHGRSIPVVTHLCVRSIQWFPLEGFPALVSWQGQGRRRKCTAALSIIGCPAVAGVVLCAVHPHEDGEGVDNRRTKRLRSVMVF